MVGNEKRDHYQRILSHFGFDSAMKLVVLAEHDTPVTYEAVLPPLG